MVDTDARQYVLRSVLFKEQEVGGHVAGKKEKKYVAIVYW